ncbi:MAG: LysM peptidoglycan-binding domain-containing protein [Myxococcota bacterium]|nr:LysM peptidoglycan-binding domain-containing protein [Myxococcota bacterium]
MSQRVVRTLLIALALGGAPAAAEAQTGVYEDTPQSLDEAQRSGNGIRISGNVRSRLIPRTYTVRRGDTLWDVTGRFYGNPWEWPRVWSYNPEITNPHWIYPLDTLRLLPPGADAPVQTTGAAVLSPARTMRSGTVFLRQEGYLDREALEGSGTVVGSPEDHMLLAPYDAIYVEFEDDYDGTPSGEWTIFREIEDDERFEDEEGELVRIFGTVRVESYDRDRRTARGTIIEALDPIERGMRVAAMPRRFDMVPPRPADRDVETRVVATLHPRELLGEQQIVFLPVGREDGVAVGNRFFIISAGDRWRDSLNASPDTVGPSVPAPDEPEAYPAEIVAEAIVVHTRPSSCTVMLTRSTREVNVGDRAEMRSGY